MPGRRRTSTNHATTLTYLNQAYSVLYQSPSRAKAVFVTQI